MVLIINKKEDFLYNYYSIKEYNPNYYKLTLHNGNMKRPTKEDIEEEKIPQDRNVNEDKLENNIIRARSKIFEYTLCNDFDYFITLTLDKLKHDRYDLDLYIKNFGQFIRDYRKKYKCDIQYVLIPELHEDKAYHMHGVIKGIPEEHLFINENNYLDWYNYKEKFGFCSIDKIRSRLATAKYITKYISKSLKLDNDTEKERKLYYCTRGLNIAKKVIEGTIPKEIQKVINFDYENLYVKLKELDKIEYMQLLKLIEI